LGRQKGGEEILNNLGPTEEKEESKVLEGRNERPKLAAPPHKEEKKMCAILLPMKKARREGGEECR